LLTSNSHVVINSSSSSCRKVQNPCYGILVHFFSFQVKPLSYHVLCKYKLQNVVTDPGFWKGQIKGSRDQATSGVRWQGLWRGYIYTDILPRRYGPACGRRLVANTPAKLDLGATLRSSTVLLFTAKKRCLNVICFSNFTHFGQGGGQFPDKWAAWCWSAPGSTTVLILRGTFL